MKVFLLDSNVLSEIWKPIPDPAVVLWFQSAEWFVPAPAIAEITGRVDSTVVREFEAAGVIDSKFGAVPLQRLTGESEGAPSCIHFLKRIDQPNLRISGWSCQGETLPARRTAIACTLNRLMLLAAGNDPKLAELFAHAERKRRDCAASSPPASSADWVTGSDNPRLRGMF